MPVQNRKSKIQSPVIHPWDGKIHDVDGFRTAALHCGIKTAKEQPPDIAIVFCEEPSAVGGAFTLNRVCAAPVTLCRNHLKKNKNRARALVINAGNANACTGEQGQADATKMAQLAAKNIGCAEHEVLVFSTGIIGHKLPMEKVDEGIQRACDFVRGQKNTGDFARAIMTTDTVPKTAAVTVEIGGKTVHFSGACKGVGMIAPNMATMLGCIATDVAVAPAVLQKVVLEIVDETFSCVTVDGDTSTNDSLAVLASG